MENSYFLAFSFSLSFSYLRHPLFLYFFFMHLERAKIKGTLIGYGKGTLILTRGGLFQRFSPGNPWKSLFSARLSETPSSQGPAIGQLGLLDIVISAVNAGLVSHFRSKTGKPAVMKKDRRGPQEGRQHRSKRKVSPCP